MADPHFLDSAPPESRERSGWGAVISAHCVGALLAAFAILAIWIFNRQNPGLIAMLAFHEAPPGGEGPWRLVPGLFQSWAFAGGAMEWLGLVWAVAGVALAGVVGWFYLEGLEIYLPRSATAALAYIFGLGLVGVVLEWLAIPFWLTRSAMAMALGGLLALLVLRAWRRASLRPESGLGGDGGAQEQLLRRALARQAWRASLTRPAGFSGWVFHLLAWTLLALITLAIFWHGLLYPEVYWDSLILYLGHARQTFILGGFPIKVVGQVGVGLGDNYPHLYSVIGAGVATAAGGWSELPQRLIAPLAGLATTLMIYHAALRLTRHVNFALAIALLYRANPHTICYDQYASDYALALLFGAAFLYLALLYLETGLGGYFAAATLLIALSMHLNYLMGILWAPWLAMIVLAHAGMGRARAGQHQPPAPPLTSAELDAAPWTAQRDRPTLPRFLFSGGFWSVALGAALIGSTWHIRNWIVTGNPVYAFFPNIFGHYRVNDDVMKAAGEEWMNNGAGIGLYGATLGERLAHVWDYFVGDVKFSHRTEPLMLGFALGGALVWLGRFLSAPFRRRAGALPDVALRFGFIVLLLAGGLLAFHFTIAPYYLYQIIDLFPCLALLAALAFPYWRLPDWRIVLGGCALWVGLVPGLTMALMGFKVPNSFRPTANSAEVSPLSLYVLRHPLPTPERFYRWRYGDDEPMWEYLNDAAHGVVGQPLLTHENRDLVLDPSITIVNLDDWDMQQLWGVADPIERVRRLIQDHAVNFYLRVPNEASAATNQRMGTAEWPRLGLAKLLFESGANRLYELHYPPVEADEATTATARAR